VQPAKWISLLPPNSECGRGPATPDRIRSWFPALPFTAWRWNDRFSPTALERSAAFAKASCRFMISRSQGPRYHDSATAAVASGPVLLPAPKSTRRMGEEAATPGQPVALARVFWIIPRQFTLENHRLPLALPQSFGKLRKLHVSLNPLSASLSRPATQKTCPLVKKLWTMCLPCGRPRKTKNKHFPPDDVHQQFQSLRSRGSCRDGRLGRPAKAKPSSPKPKTP
jgi:hypothetical protein